MLSCFDLSPGREPASASEALARYAAHMRELGLLESMDCLGERRSDTILDTDDQRDQQYFLLMHFRDRAQSDSAVAYIESGQQPAASLHKEAYAGLQNLVFICWQDFSGAVD